MNTLIRNDMDTYDHLQHSIILQNPLLSDEVGTINHETRSRKPDGRLTRNITLRDRENFHTERSDPLILLENGGSGYSS